MPKYKMEMYKGSLIEHKQQSLKELFITADEGTALCNILANRYNRWRATLGGDILVNGVYVSPCKKFNQHLF